MLRNLLMIAVFVAAACGGADEPDTPAEKCEALVSQWCAFAGSCGGGDVREQCSVGLRARLDCSRAVSVTTSYEVCLLDIRALRCPVSALPPTCQGVIKLAPTDGGAR